MRYNTGKRVSGEHGCKGIEALLGEDKKNAKVGKAIKLQIESLTPLLTLFPLFPFVHYMSRKAGQSKMQPLKHGIHVLKAYLAGFIELVLKR